MSSDDSFENRLKAIADQVARSLANTDVDDVVQRFGLDPDSIQKFTSTVETWVNDHLDLDVDLTGTPPAQEPSAGIAGTGPHPLDLPTGEQGLALSALDSGRFTVRPGSGELLSDGQPASLSGGASTDLVNELRARDWITSDGTVTLVGHQALLRWCRTADVQSD